MSVSQPKQILTYNPSTDKMMEVEQKDWDLLEYRMQLMMRIGRIKNIETLKELCKVLNDKHE